MIGGEPLDGIALKAIGAVAGAILALAFIPPVSMSEFWRRLAASVITGLVFASLAREWLGLGLDTEGIIASACASAFAGWWVMGAFIRIVRNYRKD